jgi:putative IMPACT (imprinted ancient) family translation regulator
MKSLKASKAFGRNGSFRNDSIQVLRKGGYRKVLLTVFSPEDKLKCLEEFLKFMQLSSVV